MSAVLSMRSLTRVHGTGPSAVHALRGLATLLVDRI